MNTYIWKYSLELKDIQTVKMPTGAKILTVQSQNNCPTLWAMVTPNGDDCTERTIEIFGTGFPIPSTNGERVYISTIQTDGGIYVWHVFELI